MSNTRALTPIPFLHGESNCADPALVNTSALTPIPILPGGSVRTNSALVSTRAPTPFSFLLGGIVSAGPALVNIRDSTPTPSLSSESVSADPSLVNTRSPTPIPFFVGGSTGANPAPVVLTPTEEALEVLCGAIDKMCRNKPPRPISVRDLLFPSQPIPEEETAHRWICSIIPSASNLPPQYNTFLWSTIQFQLFPLGNNTSTITPQC